MDNFIMFKLKLNLNEIHSPDIVMQKIREDNFIKTLHTEILGDINKLVGQIHEEFGNGCLILRHEFIDIEQRYGLWTISNIYLNTAYSEGMNLSPFEFVSVKQQQGKLEKASCIISEFSGCKQALNGAYLVNPYNIEEISKQIDFAITQKMHFKSDRMGIQFSFINKHSTLKWAQGFLTLLKKARKSQADS